MTRSTLQETIVYLGNDDLFSERLSNVCSSKNIKITKVDGGKDSIDRIVEASPVMIIASARSTEISGFDVLEKVRDDSLAIPVILSGSEDPDVILNAFRAGAADYIPETSETSDIEARLDILLNRLSLIKVPQKSGAFESLDALEEENRELRTLLKITASFDLSGNSKKELLNNLTEVAADSMNCEAASIMLVNERRNELEFIVATGEKKNRLETMTVPLGEGIAGWVAVTGKSQIVNDTSKDKRFTGKVDEESGFVTRQILAVPLLLDNKITGVLEVINTRDKRELNDNDLRKLTDIGDRAVIAIEATRMIEDQQNYYGLTTNIIVRAIERKDMFSIGHPWQVAELCHKMAVKMNLSETEISDLHFGALLHDVGKLEMPSSLFNKRELSDRELEFIRQHPVKGAKLIEPINVWKGIVPYILYHHEAWDGSGYPIGRAGTSIPMGARIINLAESFSIMRSPNSYKRRMSIKEAILEVMRMAGKQFDPDIVKVFVSVLEKDINLK